MKLILILISVLILACVDKVDPVPHTNGVYCLESDKDFIESRYDLDYSERSRFTIDHIIPLSLGGSNSEDNLWPEPRYVKACRNNLEIDMYNDLKYGRKTRAEAVAFLVDIKFKKICY
jgi:hypothetical protein